MKSPPIMVTLLLFLPGTNFLDTYPRRGTNKKQTKKEHIAAGYLSSRDLLQPATNGRKVREEPKIRGIARGRGCLNEKIAHSTSTVRCPNLVRGKRHWLAQQGWGI